jgi:hypothetical protein
VTTPADYPDALVASLWGGVAGSTAGVDFTAEATAAMQQAMDGEDGRRVVAEQSPGLGASVQLPDNPVGPGVGKAGLLDTVGEGHSVLAGISAAVHKAYGADRPQYAPPVVGGEGYRPGDVQTVLRVLGERAFAQQDGLGRGGVTVVSPPAPRRSLLGRLFGRRRSR